MIIPSSNSRVRKFVVSEKFLKAGIALAGIMSMALLPFFSTMSGAATSSPSSRTCERR
jgi:hypothetical protein